VVVQAVLAVEDRDFYEHDGVNPQGIMRAMFQNVRSGSVQQGGSTITQQYVLNSFNLARDGGLSRKVKEAVLSVKLEQQMSKDEILEGYLNTIFFGRGAYGIATASRAYFNKDVTQITDPGQAALLAGLIRAPAAAEPTEHPEEAARRRHTGLVAMHEEGYITEEQLEVSDAIPVDANWVLPLSAVRNTDTLRGAAPNDYFGTDYLSWYIEAELKRIDPERFGGEDGDRLIRGSGLRIYTSLDYAAQKAAWQAVTSTLNLPEDPQAAMVAVDDQGLVKAMVGNRLPFAPGEREQNYAVRGNGSSGREPGSTFKPVVLAEALREGYSLNSRYDAQGTMEFDQWMTEGEPWKVSNYSESDAGVMDLTRATSQSSNTAYAQLMLDLGVDPVPTENSEGQPVTVAAGAQKVAELAERMGVMGGDIPSEQTAPAMVLGTVNATPLEMAGVYSTFMNRGVYRQPNIITRVEQVDEGGGPPIVLYQRQLTEDRVMSETQADLVTHALQAVVDEGGTGEGASLGDIPAAGKTGTSQRNRNAWFAGYVPGLTAVVWMGYPETDYVNPETGRNELWPMNEEGKLVHGRTATGGSFPADIWRGFMEVAAANVTGDFVEVTEDQIRSGEALNEGELQTPSETTVPPAPGGPGWTIPDITLPNLPGGPGPTRPSDTTTTSAPDVETTTTTEGADTTVGPPGPGGGGP
jgi:penicillin-binding protein 1A